MSLLAKLTSRPEPAPAAPAQPDLERMLSDLVPYGKPRLSFFDSGWRASIEMNTNAAGARFEVGSEFGMPTPSEAVIQLSERVRAAVATVGVAPR